jgi:outer membrane biosynthesis protein TonB
VVKATAPESGAIAEFPAELSSGPPGEFWYRKRHWIAVAIIALLFHLLILLPKIPGFGLSSPARPRIDIQQVDPAKLDAIRKQWKSREQQLLLDKNLHTPTAKEPPPDARYMSDRNMRVEKEQRARETTVMPKAARPGEPSPSHPKTEPARPEAKSRGHLPSLGNLGVPLPAAPTRAAPRQPVQQASHLDGTAVNGGEDGGSQYMDDRSLSEGSENLLNAQESVYYSFYARLYEAIGPIWQSKIRQAARSSRLQPGEYITSVDVVFDREGNLLAVNQVKGSGVEAFDRAASSSWRAVGRFPNPPEGLLNANGQVHTGWTFAVQLNQGMGLEYLPPERVY